MKQWCIWEKEMACPRCQRVNRELVEWRGFLTPGLRICVYCQIAEQVAYETLYPDKTQRGKRYGPPPRWKGLTV